MPANLTPAFLKARERFRAATSPEEKLAALEEMLATIPKHKGTDKMQADIKRRIAKLRERQSHGSRGKGRSEVHVDHEGAGQVTLVGTPCCGKSSLLAALTNARPEIADYPFSTLRPGPGMMRFEDVSIQLVDLPPLTPEYTESWVYNIIRDSDLALLLIDGATSENPATVLDEYRRLALERHVLLAVGAADESGDERTRRVPCRVVVTKSDLSGARERSSQLAVDPPPVLVSTATGEGLDVLPRAVFDALEILRVYTKLPGKPADLHEPYTLPRGSTVLDAARIVHREFVDRLKYVRVWGSGRFDGQQVPTDHALRDKDIVEIHVH